MRCGRVLALGLAAAAAAAVAVALAGACPGRTTNASVRAVQVKIVSGAARGEVGAGFSVGRGRIVTAAHLVEDGGKVRIRGRARWLAARLLRLDPRSDLALLAVRALGGAAAGPGITTRTERGDELRLVVPGRPAVAVTVRRAITARLRRAWSAPTQQRSALELHSRVGTGDSGAPVVTAAGAVAGVLFARSRRRPDTAYAVDGGELRRFLEAG